MYVNSLLTNHLKMLEWKNSSKVEEYDERLGSNENRTGQNEFQY